MHLSVLEASVIFASCSAMSSLLGIFYFHLTSCDVCWRSLAFWDRSCRTGTFEVIGGLGPMELLVGIVGAWISGVKVNFLVLSTWLSGPNSYSGLIVKLLVGSILFPVSPLDELSSSTKTSGFIASSGPSSLMSVLTTFWLSPASFWSSNVTSKRRSFSASLGSLLKSTTFLSLNTTFIARVSLRVSMSCNKYAVLLLS